MGNIHSKTPHRRALYKALLFTAFAVHAIKVSRRSSSKPHILARLAALLAGRNVVKVFIGNVLGYYLFCHLYRWFVRATSDLERTTPKALINYFGGMAFDLLKLTPAATRLQLEADKVEADMTAAFHKDVPRENELRLLPKEGRSSDAILEELNACRVEEDPKWQDGRVSGAVYHGGDAHLSLLNAASSLFSVSNPLHPDVWPSVNRMEAEVLSMTASMLNGGDDGVCGLMTSGGTESIFMSVRTHLRWARAQKGIQYPELIMPVTAHAAFDKACDIMGIRLIKLAVDPVSLTVSPRAVRAALTADTIMIVGSAPQYPHGVIDPIQQLSDIAQRASVGLHVDCCLGGFFLPFARKCGAPIPEFDFALPGVTAISCDTHKYGYASKGTSVTLFRNKALRHHAYFKMAEWPGGLYCTPTLPGSRPGALSVACWASMVHLGEDGYVRATGQILETVRAIRAGVEAMDGITLLGDPQAMIVAFGSDDFNVHHVGDRMGKLGWSLNSLQRPAAVHICCTLRHVGKAQEFLDALAGVVAEVRANPESQDKDGNAPIYGMTGSMPAGCVEDLLNAYIDVTLKL